MTYTQTFDLDVLLDEAFWQHKAKRLAHNYDEIVRLSKLNKIYDISHLVHSEVGTFSSGPIHEFLDFKESVDSENFTVKHLFWQNEIDSAVPY